MTFSTVGRGAHPRSRGEHTVSHSPLSSFRGSSPLARGTRVLAIFRGVSCGLIPARAGNTVERVISHASPGAHPRSRGEHVIFAVLHAGLRGSSPLARGTLLPTKSCADPNGLIPARAGNTAFLAFYVVQLGAHPRSRGEHSYRYIMTFNIEGSSPLARGTPQRAHLPRHAPGLIPARAGNTDGVTFSTVGRGAHPRSRGEHLGCKVSDLMSLGSSPLARGTRKTAIHELANFGLIPARAGNTHGVWSGYALSGAHPRSRGEHTIDAISSAFRWGSSPLARGTLFP